MMKVVESYTGDHGPGSERTFSGGEFWTGPVFCSRIPCNSVNEEWNLTWLKEYSPHKTVEQSTKNYNKTWTIFVSWKQ